MNGLRIGSLFSGIGGIELGLEQAGVGHTVFHVEADPFCQQILGKRWPGVPCYHDVREVGAGNLPDCDILCGGFPCQDISNAGRRQGLEGDRSGLWFEFARLIGEIRPKAVIIENVAALRKRGLNTVLQDLASLGYDAEWETVAASSLGAWHQRKRLFIVAAPAGGMDAPIPNADGNGQLERRLQAPNVPGMAEGPRLDSGSSCGSVPDAGGKGLEGSGLQGPACNFGGGFQGCWTAEPPVDRVADGIPARVDRIKSLGNAVVPEVARSIGTRLLARGVI